MPKHTLSPDHAAFLKATFERNAALFGGYTMEADPTDPPADPPADPADPVEEPPVEEEPTGDNPEDAPEDEPADKGDTLSHDDALSALSKVRKSEAKYRTRLREIESQLEEAKTPEQVEALLAEVRSANASEARGLLVENVALKHGLPSELADALKGETRDELEAHAKVLAKFAPATPSDDPDLSGGLAPGSNEGTFTEAEARAFARKARNRRY